MLLKRIRLIKAEHPLWGYRRIWAYLRYRQGFIVGKNRVYRVMKENQLLVKKDQKLRAVRSHYRSKPKANRLNHYWGMDMTKILFPAGWWYLHVVKDWFSKEIVGYSFSCLSRTQDWLDALGMAINNRYPEGIETATTLPELITDNGCQPTSEFFMKSCAQLGIKQIFTSFNNPKGNADTERVMRTIKEDLVWIYDWQCPIKFEAALKNWVHHYNTDYPHMALGWQTPQQVANQNTLLLAA